MVHMFVLCTVSPDAIHEHVKTKTEQTQRLHYAAPELATAGQTTAADIYAFGICTLEVRKCPCVWYKCRCMILYSVNVLYMTH